MRAQVSDRQLFERIVAGCAATESGHEAFVADRAELIVRTAAALRCRSRSEVLAYLGTHFRGALRNVAAGDSDIEVRRACRGR